MSTSSIKRQIRRFHVVVVRWTSKKCTKKRDARAELLFWSLNLLFFAVVVVVVQCLSSLLIRSFSNNDGENNENVKKKKRKRNRFIKQNNDFARASRLFVTARLRRKKCLISRFMEDIKKRRKIFLSLSKHRNQLQVNSFTVYIFNELENDVFATAAVFGAKA